MQNTNASHYLARLLRVVSRADRSSAHSDGLGSSKVGFLVLSAAIGVLASLATTYFTAYLGEAATVRNRRRQLHENLINRRFDVLERFTAESIRAREAYRLVLLHDLQAEFGSSTNAAAPAAESVVAAGNIPVADVRRSYLDQRSRLLAALASASYAFGQETERSGAAYRLLLETTSDGWRNRYLQSRGNSSPATPSAIAGFAAGELARAEQSVIHRMRLEFTNESPLWEAHRDLESR